MGLLECRMLVPNKLILAALMEFRIHVPSGYLLASFPDRVERVGRSFFPGSRCHIQLVTRTSVW